MRAPWPDGPHVHRGMCEGSARISHGAGRVVVEVEDFQGGRAALALDLEAADRMARDLVSQIADAAGLRELSRSIREGGAP